MLHALRVLPAALLLLLLLLLLSSPGLAAGAGHTSANLSLLLSARPTGVDAASSSLAATVSLTLLIRRPADAAHPPGQDVTAQVRSGALPLPRVSLPDAFSIPVPSQVEAAVFRTATLLAVQLRFDPRLPCRSELPFLYPFDSLLCTLHLRVEGWGGNDALLKLGSTPTRRSVGAFEVSSAQTATGPCPDPASGLLAPAGDAAAAARDCLVLNYRLERHSGRLLASIFLPTALIVCLTFLLPWITFLVVPARAVVSCLSFVHLANHTVMARYFIPEGASYTMMDLWLNGCLLCTFCANLGFVLVHRANYNAEKIKAEARRTSIVEKEERKSSCSIVICGADKDEKLSPDAGEEDLVFGEGAGCHPKMVDVRARMVLPIIFLLFNAVYWILVLTLTNNH